MMWLLHAFERTHWPLPVAPRVQDSNNKLCSMPYIRTSGISLSCAPSALPPDTTMLPCLHLGPAHVKLCIPPTCRSQKPRKCRTCFGAGYYPCAACLGRGKTGGCLTGAPPLATCACCTGNGRQLCADCNSTGLANNWLWSPKREPGVWGARGEW